MSETHTRFGPNFREAGQNRGNTVERQRVFGEIANYNDQGHSPEVLLYLKRNEYIESYEEPVNGKGPGTITRYVVPESLRREWFKWWGRRAKQRRT